MDYGFYSGDHHIHAAGCAHYTNPTEGRLRRGHVPARQGRGAQRRLQSDLGAVLRFPAAILRTDRQQDQRAVHRARSTTSRSAASARRRWAMSACSNLRDQTYPGSEGTKTKGWPTWTTPLMRWAKNQGAYTGYAHSANGLGIDPKAAAKRLFDSRSIPTRTANSPGKKPTRRAACPKTSTRIDANKDGFITRRRTDRQRIEQRRRIELPNLRDPGNERHRRPGDLRHDRPGPVRFHQRHGHATAFPNGTAGITS